MFGIDVVVEEQYDEESNEFVASKTRRVDLEHSLVTLSKWEAIWQKAFLSEREKTPEEILSYLKIMIQGEEPPPEVFHRLVEKHMDQIQSFIESEHSATRLPDPKKVPGSREVVTAELIRYWMSKLNIPPEYDRWHLKRLIMQIRVVAYKDTPAEKRSNRERRDLNRERLAKYNTTG